MISKRRYRPLLGNAAKRAIEACLDGMRNGELSARQVRDAIRCEPCDEMLEFENFVRSEDAIISEEAARLLAMRAPERLVPILLEDIESAVKIRLLKVFQEVKYSDLEDLTPLLRSGDSILVETALQIFVTLGRADLLFGLAVSGDDETTTRVKRFLHEQGYL